MKQVEFQERIYSVPDWANYITMDYDGGSIIVWENMPVFTNRGNFMHDLRKPENFIDPGKCECIGHEKVIPLIAKID